MSIRKNQVIKEEGEGAPAAGPSTGTTSGDISTPGAGIGVGVKKRKRYKFGYYWNKINNSKGTSK